MKKFDFYEFSGILLPGAVLLFGLSLLYPLGLIFTPGTEFTIGELGLFGILAYATGHIIQTLGRGIETLWWKAAGGLPSDWLRTRQKGKLLAAEQINELHPHSKKILHPAIPEDLSKLSAKDWYAITRQVYATVRRAGLNERIDIFNGTYGMFRGMSASLVVLTILGAVEGVGSHWKLMAVFAVAGICALVRMHEFGVTYAREVFVQFLAVQPADLAKPRKDEED